MLKECTVETKTKADDFTARQVHDVLRFLRWMITAAITFLWVTRSLSQFWMLRFYPSKADKFRQIVRAYEMLTQTPAQAERWVAIRTLQARWWPYQRYCLWPMWVTLSAWSSIGACREIHRSQGNEPRKGVVPRMKQWFHQSDRVTRRVCVLWTLITCLELFYVWQTFRFEQDPFKSLGMNPTTSSKTIEKAYRKMSIRYQIQSDKVLCETALIDK